jgi:hypothetical protein
MKTLLYFVFIGIPIFLCTIVYGQSTTVYGYVTGSSATLTLNADSVALWFSQFYADGSKYSAQSVNLQADAAGTYYCIATGTLNGQSIVTAWVLDRSGDVLYRPRKTSSGGGFQLGLGDGKVAHRCIGAPCTSCGLNLEPPFSCICNSQGSSNHEIFYTDD